MKSKECRELSSGEANLKLKELQDSLFKLKVQHSGKQLSNVMKLREARRNLARLITILKEKSSIKK